MNKKLLILSAIATGLLLTACVKKESPTENDQEQTQAVSEPTNFQPLEATQVEEVTIPTHVEVERTEIQVVRTEVQPTAQATATNTETSQETVQKPVDAVVNKPTPAPTAPKASNGSSQSEDDAVAAAIAAATPALNN